MCKERRKINDTKENKNRCGLREDTNCYIIQDSKSKEAIVIDPAGNVEEIIKC